MWGHDGVLIPGRVGLTCELECILLHASVCSRLFKWLNQFTQVAQSDYSSGSISLLKWLNQTTQVAQSASTADCVTQFSRILNPMQSSAQPDAVESLTQRSHILNPVQPHQLVNGSTLFVYLIWVLNDYQGELAFLRVPSGTITGTIRDNHEFYDMPEWLPGRILKIQGTEYHTVRCRFFFPILYQVYYIYTFTSFTLYVIREEKDFFSTFQLILPEKMSKTLVRMKIKS